MKIEEVPQDLKYYEGTVVRDVNYAVDDEGHYKAVMSDGWAPKTEALALAPTDNPPKFPTSNNNVSNTTEDG